MSGDADGLIEEGDVLGEAEGKDGWGEGLDEAGWARVLLLWKEVVDAV